MPDVPELTEETRSYLASEVVSDLNNHPEGLERIRWNSKSIWMLLKRITDLEYQLAEKEQDK